MIGNRCICRKLEVAPICDKMRKGQLGMVSTSATKTNECTSKEQYDSTQVAECFWKNFPSFSYTFNEVVSDQINDSTKGK